jgi:multimeric flavodoxin WrbA
VSPPTRDGIIFGTPTRFGNMCAQMGDSGRR